MLGERKGGGGGWMRAGVGGGLLLSDAKCVDYRCWCPLSAVCFQVQEVIL